MRTLTYSNGTQTTTSFAEAKKIGATEISLVPVVETETEEMRAKRLDRIKKVQGKIRQASAENL